MNKVDLFRQRPLEGAYPYLWLDAKHVKVRDHGRVLSKAVVVAYAVHATGVREVIGLDVGEVESGASWTEFLRSLKQRGLDGVRLAISDAHMGLKTASAQVLGCAWQRCTVHFTRDMLMHLRAAPTARRRRRTGQRPSLEQHFCSLLKAWRSLSLMPTQFQGHSRRCTLAL
ncbi:MAG: transposase [Solirubrobacteraceae bacterium]|jgi:transposase-like protein